MYQILNNHLIIAQAETKAGCIEQLAFIANPTIVKIEQIKEAQHIVICNNLWTNKEVRGRFCSYSMEYTRQEILNDIALKICIMNGYTIQKVISI